MPSYIIIHFQLLSSPDGVVQLGGLAAFDQSVPESRHTVTMLLSKILILLRATQVRRSAGHAASQSVFYRMGDGSEFAEGGEGPTQPCAEFTRAVLPNIAVFIRSIHSVGRSDFAGIPLELIAVKSMRRSDMISMLDELGKNLKRPMNDQENWLDYAQLWLLSMRDISYEVFTHAARHGALYEDANILRTSLDAVFSHIEHFNLRNIRSILRHVVTPLLKYCPRNDDIFMFLSYHLAPAYSNILAIVFQLWQRRQLETEARVPMYLDVSAASGLAPELVEIIEDKLLTDTTQEIAAHFQTLLLPVNSVGEQGKDTPEIGWVANAFLQTPELFDVVMQTAAVLMTLQSSTICRIATETIQAIVPILIAHAQGQFALTTCILPAAMSALSQHGEHNDAESALLSLITFVPTKFYL